MKEHFSKKDVMEKITPVIENTAMRHNLIPLEISMEKENGHWFLRIFIHCNDHPINHTDCGHITNGLGDLLDELIPFKYYLEVSSPGLDRRMRSSREYIVFKNHTVKIKIKELIDEELSKNFQAEILDYNEGLGLKVLAYETGKEYLIKDENIFSVRLDEIK